MYAKVEKSSENGNKVTDNSVGQRKHSAKPCVGFVDNRQEAVAQSKLQESINTTQMAQLKTANGSIIQRMYCDHCRRDVVDSDQHDLGCSHYSLRTFQTAQDRANRTRSNSFDRRSRSGSFDRVHEHENNYPGGVRFEHVIGHTNREGVYTGRPK